MTWGGSTDVFRTFYFCVRRFIYTRQGSKSEVKNVFRKNLTNSEISLDKSGFSLYNTQAFGGDAAIAQSVERILGKDEVASSNLASSSIQNVRPIGWAFFAYGADFLSINRNGGKLWIKTILPD